MRKILRPQLHALTPTLQRFQLEPLLPFIRLLVMHAVKAVTFMAYCQPRRKGEPGKVAIARRLRAETTMTLAWIAERLHIGAKTHLTHLLYWGDRTGKPAKRG